MSRSLDMTTVAEGVEERVQVDMLKRLGCDYIQGYYFAKPMPIPDFERLGLRRGAQRRSRGNEAIMIGIRIIFCLFLLALVLGPVNGRTARSPVDVLTQSPPSKDRIPVTVLVKNAFSINAFERMVEEKFPQIDIIQVGNFTSDRGIVEYKRRLEHDDLTDIIMTWPLDVGETHWESRLLDLSSMPFTSRYNTAMLNSIARDGKLYYLPGPAQVRGIVYNKTLFEEKAGRSRTISTAS